MLLVVILWILVGYALGNALPSDFLGLARDFTFDITVANHDRLSFSSQASGIQSFTFYSEGDLTDNLAFYLYGLWTFESGQHWNHNGTDARFFLVKTKNRLPVERYEITAIVEGSNQVSSTHRNILLNLKKLCESMYELIGGMRHERTHDLKYEESLHPSLDALIPEIPSVFRALLAKTTLGFYDHMDANLPSFVPQKARSLERIKVPEDFNYTWQAADANNYIETLSVSYYRGSFRVILGSGFDDFSEIVEAVRRDVGA